MAGAFKQTAKAHASHEGKIQREMWMDTLLPVTSLHGMQWLGKGGLSQ